MQIIIIGAGPVGCYLGYLLAEKHDVKIFEEHKEIGLPVRCSGIITSKIDSIIRMPQYVIINRISRYEFKGSHNISKIMLSKPDYIVNRKKFDEWLAKKAKERGVRIYQGYRLMDISADKVVFSKDDKQIKIQTSDKIVIGADGPQSKVSRYLGNNPEYFLGIQKDVDEINNEHSNIGIDLMHGKFAWKVPVNNGVMRIGLLDDPKKAKINFDKFTDKGEEEIMAGLIPVYEPKICVNKRNIFLVGDAAGQVKATTGGGIVQGLLAANALEKAITQKLSYRKCLKKLNRQLLLHLIIRTILDRMNIHQKDILLDYINKPSIKRLIENTSRDNVARIIMGMIISIHSYIAALRIILKFKEDWKYF